MIRLLAVCACLTAMFTAPATAQWVSWYRGGSNYMWYAPNGWGGKDYTRFSVIKNLDKLGSYPGSNVPVIETVGNQLLSMYQGGQRRLRIGLYHARIQPTDPMISNLNCGGPAEELNYVVNSYYNAQPGQLSPQCTANLRDFLTMVRDAGFQEVLFGFFPAVSNDPQSWTALNESLYQENKATILTVRAILQQVGIPYRIDLGNEMALGSSASAGMKQYTARLWSEFPFKSETVGFSVSCADWTHMTCIDRISSAVADIYRGSYPPVFSLHFYGNTYNNYVQAFYTLRDRGLGSVPWIIGEAYYDDATEAADLQSAHSGIQNTILYLTQWPSDRSLGDRNPPLSFQSYITGGF